MKLRLSSLAQADRDHIFDYIEADNPDAAIRIDLIVGEALQRLKEFPLLGKAGRHTGTREWVIPRSPYLVVYTCKDDLVWIVRILHGAQRWPDKPVRPKANKS